MKMRATVKEFMTPHPHSIGVEQSLETAHEIMRKNNIRHLPVLHGGKVVGMLSARDLHLIETLSDVDPGSVTVEEAMSSDPYSVAPNASLRDVCREMAEHKYGAAIVIEAGKIVGMFTTIDALRALDRALGELST